MQAKADGFQVCIGSLRFLTRRRDGAPDTPPQIDLVVQVERQLQFTLGRRTLDQEIGLMARALQ